MMFKRTPEDAAYIKQEDCMESKCKKETNALAKARKQAEIKLVPLRKKLTSEQTSKADKIRVSKRMDKISDTFERDALQKQTYCLMKKCQKEVKTYCKIAGPVAKKACNSKSKYDETLSCMLSKLAEKANKMDVVSAKDYSAYTQKVKDYLRKEYMKNIK